MTEIIDTLKRPLHDVRISVIDRCNFRCPYCMPLDAKGEYKFLAKKNWLTFEEIVRMATVFAHLGAQKLRITGGEPLLRPAVPELIAALTQIPNVTDIALTTNGALLEKYAGELKAAGLKRLTVSLDTLDPKIFQLMGGTTISLSTVLDGIRKAEEAGFRALKINVVIQKGLNDGHILDLVEYFRGTGHVVRFIEYMDVGTCNHWDRQYVVPSREILQRISQKYPLRALKQNYYGEVAERYTFEDGSGEIGFISSVTQPFCESCTRLRLTTDGRLVTCLFAKEGLSIRENLRQGASDEELQTLVRGVWQRRTDQYSNQRAALSGHPDHEKKLEMYQVGG